MALYNLAGVPAPRTHFLQFRVIDEAQETHPSDQYTGDLWGLYLAIEYPDSRFLDEHGRTDETPQGRRLSRSRAAETIRQPKCRQTKP